MELKMYSVFDKSANAYLPPFCTGTEATAIRAFSDSVKDTTHAFYRNPQDYFLYFVGVFNDDLGFLGLPDNSSQAEAKVSVITAMQIWDTEFSPPPQDLSMKSTTRFSAKEPIQSRSRNLEEGYG